MIITNTYIVLNTILTSKLRQIKHFSMDLGRSIVNKSNNFDPSDVIIQKHYVLHQDLIHSVGRIGSLPIYSLGKLHSNTLLFCNEKKSFLYTLNDMASLYDNINTGLDLFFTQLGVEKNISTVKEEEKKSEYVQPIKPINQMTPEERVMFARNR